MGRGRVIVKLLIRNYRSVERTASLATCLPLHGSHAAPWQSEDGTRTRDRAASYLLEMWRLCQNASRLFDRWRGISTCRRYAFYLGCLLLLFHSIGYLD